MKKCNNCGKEYDDSVDVCSECKAELLEIVEEKTDDVTNQDATSGFCVFCGGKIVADKGYCSKCGKSAIEEGKKHCIECGEPLTKGQKFCSKCGHKISNVVVPESINNASEKLKSSTEKMKKINKKKIMMIAVCVVVLVVLGAIGKNVISKLMTTTEDRLVKGDYIEAYDKAKKDEKEDVLVESLIITICRDAKEGLKDPDSFKLREAYYVNDEDKVVIKVQGTNSYGGEVSSYWYYKFDEEDNKYELWTTISDFDKEETYSWDDYSDKIEKLLKNTAKEQVKEIINNDDNKLENSMVKRINSLNKKSLLEDVELPEEFKDLYPVVDEV